MQRFFCNLCLKGSDGEGSLSSSQFSISTISKPSYVRPAYSPTAAVGWVSADRARKKKKKKRRRGQPPNHLGRTTRMLGLVTLIAIIGYVPFLTVQASASTFLLHPRYYKGRVSVSVCLFNCVCVFPVFLFNIYLISVVSASIKLKLGRKIKYTHSLILLKIHNDSFHDKNASEK